MLSTFRYALFAATIAACAYGQTEVARNVGTVTDASGAVVPGGTVTVKNENTGQSLKVTSNENGLFVATQLLPSAYTVKVESTGMATAEFTGIRLQVGQERTL